MNSLKKAEKFVWTEDMEKDFLELKGEFSAGRIQAYPDFDSECSGNVLLRGSRTFPGLLGAEV